MHKSFIVRILFIFLVSSKALAFEDLTKSLKSSRHASSGPTLPPASLDTPAKITSSQQPNQSKPASTQANASSVNNQTPQPGQTKASHNKKPTSIRDEAFKRVLENTLPLTPEQILELNRQQDKSKQAIATSPGVPPRPVSSTIRVDLSPGVTPPLIRLAAGFVSSMVFVDTTGQPWPIVDYSLGDPKSFNIQWDRKTNTLFIQSLNTYSSANLAVRLQDLDTPVMISLVSGQREVDYRADIQVNQRGPNAEAPIVGESYGSGSLDSMLISVLDGVPPQGSTMLKVSGGEGQAYALSDGRLIFRTQLTLLSPGWMKTLSSPDGTRVYELMQTPFILATKDGKTVNIKIEGA